MSNGSEVLIYLSFLLKEAVIYLVAAATPNKHMVAMYQKLSFTDFILFYNSKNRHLEFLNLSPQGLISSIEYCWISAQVISKAALVSLVLSSLALRSLSWGPARAQSAFPLNIAHSRVGRALV